MIYSDNSTAEPSSTIGSVYIHVDPYAVLSEDGSTAWNRVDALCDAVFSYNCRDGSIHFEAGDVFSDPDDHNSYRKFQITGDLAYYDYNTAKLHNVIYTECESEGPTARDKITEPVSFLQIRASNVPLSGEVPSYDRKAVFFQHPDVIELILRVPKEMVNDQEFTIPEPQVY